MSDAAVLDAPATTTPSGTTPAASTPAATPAAVQPTVQAPATSEKPVAPAEPVYALALPKDSTLDAAAVERATAFAKGQKLAPDAAQKALEYADAETKAFLEQQKADYTAKINAWEKTVKEDKELGGEQFTTTLKRTTSVMDRFAKPGSHKYADELRTALNQTGFGNYPPFVWLMAQIGASMESDGPTVGNPAPGGAQKSPEERMFPSSAGK